MLLCLSLLSESYLKRNCFKKTCILPSSAVRRTYKNTMEHFKFFHTAFSPSFLRARRHGTELYAYPRFSYLRAWKILFQRGLHQRLNSLSGRQFFSHQFCCLRQVRALCTLDIVLVEAFHKTVNFREFPTP